MQRGLWFFGDFEWVKLQMSTFILLENETDAIRKTNIKRLEKYIHVLVKGYKGQRLIGEDLTVRNKEFGLNDLITIFGVIGTSNLYPNDVFI